MKKITALTAEQEAKFPYYIEKWKKIGLSTEPANRPEAEKGIELAYKTIGLKKPKIVWTSSPLRALLVRSILNKRVSVGDSVWDDSVWNSVWASVYDSVGNSVDDSVRDSVYDSVKASVRASVYDSVLNSVLDSVLVSVGNSVDDSVYDSVRNSVVNSVWNSVWASVYDSVLDSVLDSVDDSVDDSVRDFIYGQHETPLLAFYDFFREECGLEKETDKLLGLVKVAENAGWFLPYKNVCIISERHNICKLKGDLIHSEEGPAIAYPDGFEIYALNGVRVPKEIVMTPANELKAELLLTEKNAEVRREIGRKIGIERVLFDLKAEILDDKSSEGYVLYNLNLGDGRKRPYLRMFNPSIKIWHLEGVPPETETVEQALEFRNGTNNRPIVLT